ncbi:MAG: hypothetical protein AAGA32_11610 [Pseudomonadota bacterium]
MPTRSLAGYAVTTVALIAVVFGVLLRPPGAMLSHAGETLTYVLCNGEVVTINTDGEPEAHGGRDCDLCAKQATALLEAHTPPPREAPPIALKWSGQDQHTARQRPTGSNATRAPPLPG